MTKCPLLSLYEHVTCSALKVDCRKIERAREMSGITGRKCHYAHNCINKSYLGLAWNSCDPNLNNGNSVGIRLAGKSRRIRRLFWFLNGDTMDSTIPQYRTLRHKLVTINIHVIEQPLESSGRVA